MRFDSNCRYHESHEWVRVEGDEAIVGISDYAQSELNDVVYVELPEVGDALRNARPLDCIAHQGGDVNQFGSTGRSYLERLHRLSLYRLRRLRPRWLGRGHLV